MARRVTKGTMGLRLEVTASELRKHVGKYLVLANEEPIGILAQNELVAILLSADEYEQFQSLKDAFLAAGAESEKSRDWHDQEQASRLASELPKRSDETDG